MTFGVVRGFEVLVIVNIILRQIAQSVPLSGVIMINSFSVINRIKEVVSTGDLMFNIVYHLV
jgi:hypothetical protein